jgi:uncharacterized membrane protein YfcA
MGADAKFIAVGLMVGTLVGFTGMGGGTLTTPLLILFGLPPVKAIGSDLLYSAITKTVGSASHARQRNVDWRIALWLAAGSVPASVIGVFTVSRIEAAMGGDSQVLLQELLGGMLIVAGLVIVGRIVFAGRLRRPQAGNGPLALTGRRKALAVAIGAVGGFGVGLTSIGSGTLFAIVLMTTFPLAARRVVGTDVFHAAMLVWAAGLAHAASGNVQFGTVAALLVGSVPGVLFGSRLTGMLPERPVRLALGSVLLLSGGLLV